MIAFDVLPSVIRALTIKKGIFGISIGRKEEIKRTEGKPLEKNSLGWTRKQDVVLSVPDSKVFVHRFEISTRSQSGSLSDNIQEKVSESIPVPVKDLCYDFSVLEKPSTDSLSREVFFIGIETSALEEYLKITELFELKVAFVVPESLALFELLKEGVGESETIAVVNIEEQATSIVFFDRYGPITTFSDPKQTGILNEGIKDALQFFQKKYGKTVKSIIVKGGGGSQILSGDPATRVISINTALQEIILSKKPFPLKKPQIPEDRYLSTIGAGLLTFHTEHLNLMHNYVRAFHAKNIQRESTSQEPTIAKTSVSTTDKLPQKPDVVKAAEEKKSTGMSPEPESKNESTETNPLYKPEFEVNQTHKAQAVTSEDEKNQNSLSLNTLETEEKKDQRKTILVILVIIAWILAMIGGFYYFTKSSNTHIPIKRTAQNNISVSSASGVMKETSPTPTTTPALNRKDVSLEILNGSGKSGVAGKAANLLEQKGYQNVATGNASGFAFKNTQIQIKESKKNYLGLLLSDLAENYQATSASSFLDETNTYDAIITIGQ